MERAGEVIMSRAAQPLDVRAYDKVPANASFSCDGCAFDGGDECLKPEEQGFDCDGHGTVDFIFVAKAS